MHIVHLQLIGTLKADIFGRLASHGARRADLRLTALAVQLLLFSIYQRSYKYDNYSSMSVSHRFEQPTLLEHHQHHYGMGTATKHRKYSVPFRWNYN